MHEPLDSESAGQVVARLRQDAAYLRAELEAVMEQTSRLCEETRQLIAELQESRAAWRRPRLP
jgi:hypothetical protein